jgi:hypothetical protein
MNLCNREDVAMILCNRKDVGINLCYREDAGMNCVTVCSRRESEASSSEYTSLSHHNSSEPT